MTRFTRAWIVLDFLYTLKHAIFLKMLGVPACCTCTIGALVASSSSRRCDDERRKCACECVFARGSGRRAVRCDGSAEQWVGRELAWLGS